jgi:hypothetical protein
MSGGFANIIRFTTASMCLFVILILSAGPAFAHVGSHPRPAVMAAFTLPEPVEASVIETPASQTPGRECPGGMGCCTLGQCPFEDARLNSDAAFDFEYRIGRHLYPEHLTAGLVGVAALPSTPPPRLSV